MNGYPLETYPFLIDFLFNIASYVRSSNGTYNARCACHIFARVTQTGVLFRLQASHHGPGHVGSAPPERMLDRLNRSLSSTLWHAEEGDEDYEYKAVGDLKKKFDPARQRQQGRARGGYMDMW